LIDQLGRARQLYEKQLVTSHEKDFKPTVKTEMTILRAIHLEKMSQIWRALDNEIRTHILKRTERSTIALGE